MISKRFLATGIDLFCSAVPFMILGPLGLMLNSSAAAPGALVAQAALILGLAGSVILFAALNLIQGLRRAPTPGQKIVEIEFDRGGTGALIRVAIGALFLLPGLFFSAWSLLLLYPAVLLLSGQSISERLSKTRMITSSEKV